MISLLFPLLTIIPGFGRSEVVVIYPCIGYTMIQPGDLLNQMLRQLDEYLDWGHHLNRASMFWKYDTLW